MKRRSSHCRWIRKILALLLLSFCTASLVLMQTNYGHITMLSSLVSHEAVDQKPKIAFLFIARNRLPLDLVWDAFFKGEKEGRFSIYVHSRPGFLFNKDTTRSAYFYGRQVNNSIQVDWGESSMIEAERILLRNALNDPFNERFAFVSDSCIPLYNFSYIYDYIMSTSTSYLDSFADTKEGRYNPKMHPIIPVHNWRKGSQWAVLVRKHAKTMVDDDIVFPEFQKHCRRRSLPEFWRDQPIPANGWKEHNCIPDEHYVQTLLAQRGLEEEITRRPLTHTSWDLSSSRDKERRGWHPVTYKLSDATPTLMETIKNIGENGVQNGSNQPHASYLLGNLLELLHLGCLICPCLRLIELSIAHIHPAPIKKRCSHQRSHNKHVNVNDVLCMCVLLFVFVISKTQTIGWVRVHPYLLLELREPRSI